MRYCCMHADDDWRVVFSDSFKSFDVSPYILEHQRFEQWAPSRPAHNDDYPAHFVICIPGSSATTNTSPPFTPV